jgi:tRNA-dihydrouridine synthase
MVVHFKHAREPSYTPYDYSMLKRLSNFRIPLIINGGINNHANFISIIEKQGANKKNILGYMLGREALKNPDCFGGRRTSDQIAKEFEDNCKLHLPKEIYVKTIQKYCAWAKDLKIEFPKENI